jgi:hypothetical protein
MRDFARHLVAELRKWKWVEGRGNVEFWENESRHANHYHDASALAGVGGDLCGVRIAEELPPPVIRRPQPPPRPIMPGGEAYLVIDRPE